MTVRIISMLEEMKKRCHDVVIAYWLVLFYVRDSSFREMRIVWILLTMTMVPTKIIVHSILNGEM